MFDIEKVRKDFPILKKKVQNNPLIYFDTAATAQKPKQVIDVLTQFYLEENATVHRAIYDFSQAASKRYHQTRKKVAKFINAKEEEIVFVKGTTEGINLIAYSFGEKFIKKGDEIIISMMEHHANIIPWQLLCERKGAILKVIPINDRAELDLDSFKILLSDKTKLVSITHVSNATGTINPIKQIIKLAHQKGAKVLIDGAQGIGHVIVDVNDLDADFYVFSAHKLYGPNGVGILFGKSDILNEMPPFLGGGDMIDKVTIEKTTYQQPPLRFEAGTPVVPEIIAFGSTIDYIEEISREEIFRHEDNLLKYATEKLEKINSLKIIGTAKEKTGIISFVVDKMHPLDIGTFLNLEGIFVRTGHHCAQPLLKHFDLQSTVRLSFGMYNTYNEIDHFVFILEELITQMAIS